MQACCDSSPAVYAQQPFRRLSHHHSVGHQHAAEDAGTSGALSDHVCSIVINADTGINPDRSQCGTG